MSQATQSDLDDLLTEHASVFSEKLGKVQGVTAKIYVNESEQPNFFKARPVSYARRDKS